jgi:DNA/RNA endonuclease YhcR with UshA esterase domain
MRTSAILIGIFSLLILLPAKAQNPPATAPTSQPSIIAASDGQLLKADMGNDVIVQGTATDAKWSASGRVFLIKFDDTSDGFQGAIFAKSKDVMEKAFNGDLTAALEGAKIEIHGKLKTFKEHPEILIDNPEQIVVLVKGPGATTQPTTAPTP